MRFERGDVLVDHQDRLTRRLEGRERAPDFLAHQRRQSLRRLVQDEEPRIGHERAAHASICCSPPERSAPNASSRGASAGKSRSTASRSQRRAPPPPWRSAAVATRFSRTVRLEKDLPPFRHEAEPELRDAIGRPARDLVPSNGSCRRRAARSPSPRATVVVLPMPFRPNSVTTSPAPHRERDAEQDLAFAIARAEVLHLEHHPAFLSLRAQRSNLP